MKLSNSRLAKGLALGLLSGAAFTQASTPDVASELTVRLYSTHVVRSITVTSGDATMRFCPQCESLPVPSPLQVSLGEGSSHLVAGGRSARQLELNGELRITTRDGATSVGAGRWSIRGAQDGMHILLTLPSERYVMAVLSSEASPDDSPESLKALAVAVRSFALVYPHRHGAEGLCDSTHCQALRVGPVAARIQQAVQATEGETLWWRGARVPAYFTQSCGGMTEDAAQLWGGATRPWLISHPDSYCRRRPGQWHLQLQEAQLRAALAAEGWMLPENIDRVQVLQRAGSGRVRRLAFFAKANSLMITAASLRFAVNRTLGWNQIRSDWYDIHYAQGQFIFDGNGHGHGVGLCQAGASEMAAEGKDYRAILATYFPGTEMRVQPGDQGWQQVEGEGWTLRATIVPAEFIAQGNRSLARAQAAWPITGAAHPIVTLYPTTELFRQATNEPGWTTASARGDEIAVQPLSVVEQHGRLEELLLHEFLHSRIERADSSSAPLWLREGLVEMLAGDLTQGRGKGRTMNIAEMERALRSAQTLEEARSAHLAAGELVARLAAARGLDTVRGWLRSGVPPGIAASQ